MAFRDLIYPETMKAHRATWYVWAGGVKIPRQATMRGTWGYDVTCSCGQFETKTGGGTKNYVASELWVHRYLAQAESADAQASVPQECPRDPETPSSLPPLPGVL